MRLTPDVVHSAPQALNCLGDRELVLRNLAIAVIENLAVARDSFDLIDLSSNIISQLGDGFPPFPRLHTLYVGSNRISNITRGVADSLPNLQTLILTSNRIQTLEQLNLNELSRFKHLHTLSILNNPVASVPDVRRTVLEAIPSLTIFNFTKVTAEERKLISCSKRPTSQSSNSKKRKRAQLRTAKQKRHRQNGHSPTNDASVQPTAIDGAESAAKSKRSVALSTSEAAAVRARIEAAKTVEEVVRIHNAVKNGTIREMLNEHGAVQAT